MYLNETLMECGYFMFVSECQACDCHRMTDPSPIEKNWNWNRQDRMLGGSRTGLMGLPSS